MANMVIDERELDLVRQWFNAVQDLNPKYLESPPAKSWSENRISIALESVFDSHPVMECREFAAGRTTSPARSPASHLLRSSSCLFGSRNPLVIVQVRP